ncbi:hypothetical protein M0805_008695 [Coniferiporia weirii]|nr:hypothetical protein M0805_008695 [Coniferiporia weirii]
MDPLREKHAELVSLFEEHAAQARTLQRQAVQEIVPDVALELDLADEETEWTVDYLSDMGALFRLFRRQKFIASFTHEALRDAVIWRLTVLKPTVSHVMCSGARITASTGSLKCPPGLSAIRCLPLDCLDDLGRPIAVLRVAALDFYADTEQLKREIILTVERMRVALQRLNEQGNVQTEKTPVLQYIIVMDVEGVSMKSIPVDLMKWYLRELQPWYYGIVGAAPAFIINYNWAHSGLWSIIKHILPASAIAKVAFPSKEELSQFIQEDYLPAVYEALKDTPDTRHDVIPIPSSDVSSLRSDTSSPSPSSSSIATSTSGSPQLSIDHPSEPRWKPKRTRSSRFSIENPFFGYPLDDPRQLESSTPPAAAQAHDYNEMARKQGLGARSLTASASRVPTLRHGRRRKRDFVRALLFLYWQRWRTQLTLGALVLVVIGSLKVARVRWVRELIMMFWGRAGRWVGG